MVLGGVVVLVVVVEFDNAGPDSLGTKAIATAPAMIRPEEQTTAKIFDVMGELRPGSAVVTAPAHKARSTGPRSSAPLRATWPIALAAAGRRCGPVVPRRRRGC